MARGLLDGGNPYEPIVSMAEQYLGAVGLALPHPTPHPPPIILLSLPTVLVDYQLAATLWLVVEVVLLGVAARLLAASLHWQPTWYGLTVLTISLFGWNAAFQEMRFGQVMLLLLVLLIGMWLLLRRQRWRAAGVLLGLSILIKPVAWPLLLWFFWRRSHQLLITATLTVAVGYGIAAAMISPSRVVAYFSSVLPTVADVYRADQINLSLWSVGWRLFYGSESVIDSWTSPPLLFYDPTLARIVSVALPLLVLAAALVLAQRQPDFDRAFGIMICASIVVAPIAWEHYLVLAAIPAVVAIGWLARYPFPLWPTVIAVAIATPVAVMSYLDWSGLAHLLAGQWPPTRTPHLVPAAPALVTLLPTAAVLALGYWLSTLRTPEPDAPDGPHGAGVRGR